MVPALVERATVPETILDLGGHDRVTGEVARICPVELLVESVGEAARLNISVGDMARAACEVEVA